MDRMGTYRGYEIAIEQHCDGSVEPAKWHASVQINLIGKPVTDPRFAVQPTDDNPGAARTRAIRVAKSIIDERPGADPVSDTDLPEE